jgi:hypothetical protein
MKKVILTSVIVVIALAIGFTYADKPLGEDGYNGNGAPSGPHFNLNLIGVPQEKTGDMDGGGHVIFVKLQGQTKIILSPGEFAVLDKNGTDGEAAFQLPNPDPDCDGTTSYSVFARALGKPGKDGTLMTGATYIDPGEDGVLGTADDVPVTMLSEDILVMVRNNGQSVFTNVSKELLYIYVDITDDDVDNPKRYPLFDPRLQDYFWQYDNNGLKIVQLRFYEIPTDVPDVADPPA